MTDTIDPAYRALAAEQEPEIMPFDAARLGEVRANRRAVMGRLQGRLATVSVTRDAGGATFVPEGARKGHILYAHGGGWTVGDSQTHGAIMSDLAGASGLTLVGPDYPLAPEHPWPAALDALEAPAVELAAAGPLVLAGDSAGGNLALGLALLLKDLGVKVAGMILFYGCYRRVFDTESHRAFGDGRVGLSTEAMRTYWDLYLSGADGWPDGDFAPLEGPAFKGLPPAFVGDAGLDVLRDDGAWLEARLRGAGVPVERQVVPGVPHGFLHQCGRYDPAFALIEAAGRFAARVTG
ncbi:alpha/beta hydrolase [Pseudoroseicyclus sp. CXY001]|uniref:alpha/beta hydrolase n=1 Tax=Pseudoroseicyclus sp. CXY001 TaxID=3242492 RepID=UPI00358DA40F